MPSSPIAKRHRALSSISSLPPFVPQRPRSPSRLALVLLLGAALALTTYVAQTSDGIDLLRLREGADEQESPMEGLRQDAVMALSPPAGAARVGPGHSSSRVEATTVPVDQQETERIAGAAELAAARIPNAKKPARPPKPKQLPVCKKTVLFRFAGRHGFGSEVSLLLRVASVAHHYGYTVFLDSTSWNYGSWESYFSFPPSPSFYPLYPTPFAPLDPNAPCRPPSTRTKRYKMSLTEDEMRAVSLSPLASSFRPNWTRRSHVYWLRDVDGLDATFLRLFVDQSKLDELHREDLTRVGAVEAGEKEKPAFLSAEETLPSVFEQAFRRMSELAVQAWTPKEEIQGMAAELERHLGVKGSERRRDKLPGDLLIGVHVRLGDKFLEADRIGPAALSTTPSPPPPDASSPGLTDELVTSYYAAAVHSVNSLLSLPTSLPASSSVSSRTRTEADRIRALFSLSTPWARLAFDGGDDAARPTLALMSDDSNAVEAFRAHPMARRFRIVGTAEVGAASSSSPDVDHRVKRDVQQAVMQKRRPEFDVDGAGHAGHGQVGGTVGHGRMQTVPKVKADVPDGFNETVFNRLPLSTRIDSARLFVRDLTVLSSRADALVVTGSSNVGRLMMLLFEARRREVGDAGGKREVRSLDTRWFPTARFA